MSEIIKTENLIRFLSTGRTIEGISKNFNVEISKVKEMLKELEKAKDYNLFQQRNDVNEEIFLCFPEIPKPEIKPRDWRFRKHSYQPYLWIVLPDTDYKKIKIVPLSDIHYGEIGHKGELFKRYVEWIAKTPNVYCFLNGDLTANALPDSAGNAIFSQLIRPSRQIKEFVELIRPIAHKILWSVPGGHEYRTFVRTDLDPSEWICQQLDIPYIGGPVYADVLWKGYTFTFYCMHGTKAPATEGGRLNKASIPLKYQEFVKFVVHGHFHDPGINKIPRICRERKFDKSGKLISHRLADKKQYVITCPSFYGYWGTYAHHRGFSPGSWGNVTCELYPNGDYHATR